MRQSAALNELIGLKLTKLSINSLIDRKLRKLLKLIVRVFPLNGNTPTGVYSYRKPRNYSLCEF
jgi:hypothetical protein